MEVTRLTVLFVLYSLFDFPYSHSYVLHPFLASKDKGSRLTTGGILYPNEKEVYAVESPTNQVQGNHLHVDSARKGNSNLVSIPDLGNNVNEPVTDNIHYGLGKNTDIRSGVNGYYTPNTKETRSANDFNDHQPATRSKSLKFKNNEIPTKESRTEFRTQEDRGRNCRIDERKKVADCSDLKLTAVPQGLPADIVDLLLSNNSLTNDSLTNGPFRRYRKLQNLLLNANSISTLPDKAFEGLGSLRNLNLHSNHIVMDSSLNQSKAFVPLQHCLDKLILNNNTKNINTLGLVYPDKALSYLSNLRVLEIDGLPNTTLGYHFQFMNNLTKLSLEGYYTGKCNLSILHDDTFIYTPTVRYLVIADCKLYKDSVGAHALAPLTQLNHLDVSYNFDLGLDGLGNLLYGQRNNKNLKTLYMKYVVQRYEPCIVIYEETVKNFLNTSLEYIDATHNNIEMIEMDAIDYLPKTLRRVNLTRNGIMFGAYWRKLKDMTSLESLDLNGYDQAFRLPSRTPPAQLHCSPHREGQGKAHLQSTRAPDRGSYDYPGPLRLQLPPNLKNLTMRSYSLSYKIDDIEFDPKNKLNYVDLHGNTLPELNGPISGLNHLEYLDVSDCAVSKISNKFFKHLGSLKHVKLYNNYLKDSLSKESAVFEAESIEFLDLGGNGISKLNSGLFNHCVNLTTIILSDNRFKNVESFLDNLPNLRYLYLALNNIPTIPETLRNHFSKMQAEKRDVYVNMKFNPIYCDCDNIDFLKWVVETKIFAPNYTDYFCTYPNQQYRTRKMEHGYEEELKILLNECSNNTMLFTIVISACVAFFLVLFGVIVYRFRWSMRYWFYVSKVMWSHNPNRATIEDDFEYDLFVCYCRLDSHFITEELEHKLGQERDVRLLLQDNCFQAGQEYAESILVAVRQSRKTLVVMSKAMLDDKWCNYELEMARQESITTGRTVLVIMFLETIPKATMTLDMLHYIRSNVSVTYPADDPDNLREEFWDKLARDLQAS